MTDGLVVIETHPIQYHAPVYRALQTQFGVPVTAIYGSDFSVAGYQDKEFGATFAWDTDLLSGYQQVFLSRVSKGGARSAEEVSTRGLKETLQQLTPSAILLVGYSPRFHRDALFFCAWRAGYPLLFRGETVDYVTDRSMLRKVGRNLFLRWFYKRFFRLLYVGKASLWHYRRLGCPESKLVFSPYCVDTGAFQLTESDRRRLRNLTRQRLGIVDSQIVILFSGKLVRRKAPDVLLKAVKMLPNQVCKQVVVFLGSGDLLETLKDMVQANPPVKAHFIGFQNQSALSQFYHAADLLVLPSLTNETWGLVVNEALHHGVPCVVSDKVGCAPDLIEPGVTGEVFKAGSAEDLTSALQRAVRLVSRPEVREVCRKKVNGYTVEKAAEGIAKAYWAVVNSQVSENNA